MRERSEVRGFNTEDTESSDTEGKNAGLKPGATKMEAEASFGAEKAASSRRTPKSEGAAVLRPYKGVGEGEEGFLTQLRLGSK